jgi:hypothetical protein
MTDIQLLDEQEVSRRLSVSVNTLRYWRVSGDGPNYKLRKTRTLGEI